jgi:hypothetical protein
MGKLGGGGLFVAGIALVLLGALIQWDFLSSLLNVLGWVVIVAGVILGIVGLIKLFSGNKGGASDF